MRGAVPIPDAVIRTDHLTKSFGRLKAVDGVSMEVPPGSIFAFLGPNGSGKTTTVYLLLGLLQPTFGSAEVLGFDTVRDPHRIREKTGVLLEYPGLYEKLTAEENLDYFGRIWHLSPRERRSRTRELLNHVGLWDRRQEPVGSWSRGMRQRLAIARAILHRPAIVFLDEPTNGLDPVNAAGFRSDILKLAGQEGVTVFLNTHNLAEAEKMCTLVGIINQGRILALDRPDRLRARAAGNTRVEVEGQGFDDHVLDLVRAHPGVLSVEGTPDHERLTVEMADHTGTGLIVALLVHAGATVEEVRREKANLEDIFLALVRENEAEEEQ